MEQEPVVQPQVQPTQPEPSMQQDEIPMNDELPQDDNMEQDVNANNDDSGDINLDGNVDGNDSKKYIQQLAGKLSQELRTYNEQQPQPDAGLNKYVAGMINKQAVEGLDGKDKEDILNKIKSDEEEINSEPQQQQPKMESVKRKINLNDKQFKNLFEIAGNLDSLIDDVMNDKDERKDDKIPTNREVSYRGKPYIAPDFK